MSAQAFTRACVTAVRTSAARDALSRQAEALSRLASTCRIVMLAAEITMLNHGLILERRRL
jgi:hypothetical protein